MRRRARWALVGLIALLAWPAEAQTTDPSFGDTGHVALSGERLFGFSHAIQTRSVPGASDSKTTSNTVSLLGSPVTAIFNIYTFPRVAFDAFVAPGVSVGASASYFHASESLGPLGGSPGSNDVTLSGFVLAPRIGFAVPLNPLVSIWPRAGITYVYVSNDTTFNGVGQGSTTTNFFAATIEVPVTVTIVPRALFLIGPTVDIGLSGGAKSAPATPGAATVSVDEKDTEFGLQAGFLIFL
jgi:hypothetical protein